MILVEIVSEFELDEMVMIILADSDSSIIVQETPNRRQLSN